MKTELVKVDPEITPGRKIEVVDYSVRNYRLRDTLEQCARLLLFCLECDTNNTASKAVPSDVKEILAQWNIVKDEFEFSLEYNDYPKGSHEYAYKIALITGKEIQKIRNVKMKTCVAELFNFLRVLVSIDSANTQAFTDPHDAENVKKMFALVDAKLERWIGDGSIDNTGVYAPAYEVLGELQPDVDSDYAELLEPSKDMPAPNLPDVPDTEANK